MLIFGHLLINVHRWNHINGRAMIAKWLARQTIQKEDASIILGVVMKNTHDVLMSVLLPGNMNMTAISWI